MGAAGDGKGKKGVLDLDDPLTDVATSIQESGIIQLPTAPPPTNDRMRDRQMTLTDDDLTEQARLASVLMDSTPPLRARLAPATRIPVLAKTLAELDDDMKDPKTAFVLGFVDGVLPLETIIEVTGLPESETVEILERLIADGAIIFPPRR